MTKLPPCTCKPLDPSVAGQRGSVEQELAIAHRQIARLVAERDSYIEQLIALEERAA